MIDDDPRATVRAFLWIGVTDPRDPQRHNSCYAVIGGDVLRQAAERILAAHHTRPARKARR